MEMVARTSRKQLVCKACAHVKLAYSLAHILTTEGDKPRIANINVAWGAHSAPANSEIIPQTFDNVWQWSRGCEASSGVGAPSKEGFDPRALQTPSSTSKQTMLQSGRRIAKPSMEWCQTLCEAIRDKQQVFANRARTIAVAMGERKGHVSLVTFWACAGLEVCHGRQTCTKQGCGELLLPPPLKLNPVLSLRAVPGPTDTAAAQAKQRILERTEMVESYIQIDS